MLPIYYIRRYIQKQIDKKKNYKNIPTLPKQTNKLQNKTKKGIILLPI